MDNILRSTFPGPKILCKQYAMILYRNIDFYVVFLLKKKYRKPKFTIYQAIAKYNTRQTQGILIQRAESVLEVMML